MNGPTGELALLAGIRGRVGSRKFAGLKLGIGDDCALLRLRAGEELALTTDLSIAGRHFKLDLHPPEAIGHRTLARGLSDLAAMGARPIAAFLSLGLPRDRTGAWVERFLDGFLALADVHKTPLAGGDLAESPVVVADIVLTGAVRRNKALLRSGARPDDLIYVTGNLGGSAAGLRQMLKPGAGRLHTQAMRFAAHLFPQPRIAQGLWLGRHSAATAALDISDGLSTDLAHLCEESHVAAEIDAARIPMHAEANLMQALHGGEDYELLFTARPGTRIPRMIGGVTTTCIGRLVRTRANKPWISLLTASGREPLEPAGWEHFA